MHSHDFLKHFHRHEEANAPQSSPPPVPLASKPRSNMIFQPQITHVNPFVTISNDPPVIPSRPDHPVPRTAIRTRSSNSNTLLPAPATPLQTNKFYSNFFLDDQSLAAWTNPYSLWWSKGRGNAKSWGMSITLIESDSIASGPMNALGSCNYFFGPVGIQHMCLSAVELGNTTSMTVDTLGSFSCNVSLTTKVDADPLITIPVVQGMGFVTAVYHSCTPAVQSSVFFRNFAPAGMINNGYTDKYKATLEDGAVWLIYRTFPTSDGIHNAGPMTMVSNSEIRGKSGFNGYIQIAKLSSPSYESGYDSSAGAYSVSGQVTAVASGKDGRYGFNWVKEGLPKPLLMFALPHHIESFASQTTACVTPLRMRCITKGIMSGVLADYWVLEEQLHIELDFAPYSLSKGSVHKLSESVKSFINSVAEKEIQQDVNSQCCLNSMYFSGKGLAKFAMIAYVLHDMTNAPQLSIQCLTKLKTAFAVFVNNQQPCPLVYDQAWKGAVSTLGLNGDPGQDFGNSFYNDHHFHYGYFVYAAAVIGYLDPSWLNQDKNVHWVNMLVRDFANPVCDDYFPFSRSFDWFAGHSWAKGLFASADGKDQESTSEDAFASYGLKMWGKIIRNQSLEASGDLKLAIQKRVFHDYFLMQSDNKIQPANFIGNKVTGILFENKIDHATYFSGAIECIQGIHMLPIGSMSTIMRSPHFVREEWETYFDNGRVDQVGGGWKGVLYANYGLIDPAAAYNFFANHEFDSNCLDGGASRTWYCAYLAALAGL